jgi:hypothetical protein
MDLKQLQSWQRFLTRGASSQARQFHRAGPRVDDAHPVGGSLSRRAFMWGAAGATGLAFALGRGMPVQAAKPSTAEPYPIPHIQLGPPPLNVPQHFFFPGPVDSTDPEHGHDPSVITDFSGVIGGAELSLTGTGIDTTTDQSGQYGFALDLRFMQGVFLGADGRQHHGTFLFV